MRPPALRSILSLLTLAAGSLLVASCDSDPGPPPLKLSHYRTLEPFTLTDQDGEDWGSDDVRGKVWIANFVFTSCAAECPYLTGVMGALRRKLGETSEVAFASFSVDPQTDNPERLKHYADQLNADVPNWRFLTGDPGALETLIKDSFLLPVATDPDEQAKLTGNDMIHSNKFAIVDRQGTVRAYVDGMEEGAVQRAYDAIQELLREPGPPSPTN